jgi:hypothetical protein
LKTNVFPSNSLRAVQARVKAFAAVLAERHHPTTPQARRALKALAFQVTLADLSTRRAA